MRIKVEHRTVYHFHRPVQLGEHRLMVRPRDSHDLRLHRATLDIFPQSSMRWVYDVFGNSIAILTPPAEPSDILRITSYLELERFVAEPELRAIEPRAGRYPFVYEPSERLDLGSTLVVEDQASVAPITAWLDPLLEQAPLPTLDLLTQLNDLVFTTLRYVARDAFGTQTARDSLALGTGSCRDYAVLLIEAARTLGLGARFVTGYLYDPSLDEMGGPAAIGSASTHAWAEVFVPGPGWIELDPTNRTINSEHLVRVAITRSATQSAPVRGTYIGTADDAGALEVMVKVTNMSF